MLKLEREMTQSEEGDGSDKKEIYEFLNNVD